jgi:hypothetical protein
MNCTRARSWPLWVAAERVRSAKLSTTSRSALRKSKGVAIIARAPCFSAKTTGLRRSKVRLEAYDRSTAPLIEFYRKAGLLLQISAAGTPEGIYNRTVPELELRRLTQFAEQMWAAAENRRSGL